MLGRKRANNAGRRGLFSFGRRKPKEQRRPEPEKKPVVTELRILAEGATDYPAFVEACKKKKIVGDAQVVQVFERLYKHYEKYPILGELEAFLEFEAKQENTAFDEAVVWADIMMANNLQAGKKVLIPEQYKVAFAKIKAERARK